MAQYLTNDTLTVPTVLWGGAGKAPSHKISVITALPDKVTVVTGTRQGHICTWRAEQTPQHGKVISLPSVYSCT